MKPLDETQNHSTKLKTGMLEGVTLLHAGLFVFICSPIYRLYGCRKAQKVPDFMGFSGFDGHGLCIKDGNLIDPDSCKGWQDLDGSEYYSIEREITSSEINHSSQPSEDSAELSFDAEKLQLALTYRDCSLYTVTPWNCSRNAELSTAEEAAIVMKYMEAISSSSYKNIPLTSINLPKIQGNPYTAYYFDENGNMHAVTFTVQGLITASGKLSGQVRGVKANSNYSIGSAWIRIGNENYFIAPSSPEALNKMLQGMAGLLMIDAAKNIEDALTMRIDPAAAFGKNGWITYLKYIFKKVGVNTDGIGTIENLKMGLEAETDEEFRKAIVNLIDIAAKNT